LLVKEARLHACGSPCPRQAGASGGKPCPTIPFPKVMIIPKNTDHLSN